MQSSTPDNAHVANPSNESISNVSSNATQGLVDASSFVVETPLHHQAVTQRIRELEDEKVRALKSHHNAATITCRLPIEILSRVFVVLAFSEPRPQLLQPVEGGFYRWIPATNVCRHWRSTAIECALLWTHFSFGYPPELTEALFKRSKNAPVDIMWRRCPPNADSLLCSSPPHINRIRSLKISTENTESSVNALLDFLRLPQLTGRAPVLEELELDAPSWSTCSLPEGFLQGGAPILASFKAIGCRRVLDKLSYSPNLTTLDLLGKTGAPITVASLLETFGQLHHLHTLRLYHFLDFDPNIMQTLRATNVPLFTFPSLCHLEVQGLAEDIDYFLQLTRCDTATLVMLSFMGPQVRAFPGEQAQRSLGNILTWWGYSTPDTKLHVHHFRLGSEREFVLHFDPETKGDSAETLGGKNHLSVAFANAYTLRQPLDVLSKRFDFQTLTSLVGEEPRSESMEDCWYSEEWSFFAQLPHLEEISLYGLITEEIIDLFKALDDGPATPGIKHAMTFPSLSTILISCDFFGDEGMTFPQFVTAFTSIAQRRRLSSCPISKLVILESAIVEAAEIKFLQESNPGLTVLWDGSG